MVADVKVAGLQVAVQGVVSSLGFGSNIEVVQGGVNYITDSGRKKSYSVSSPAIEQLRLVNYQVDFTFLADYSN